jgi:hypothetical protein
MSESSESIPAGAIEALKAFLIATERQDLEGMRAYLSRRTLEADDLDTPPQQLHCEAGQARMVDNGVLVSVQMRSANHPGGRAEMETPFLLVQEEGQWKVDLVWSLRGS